MLEIERKLKELLKSKLILLKSEIMKSTIHELQKKKILLVSKKSIQLFFAFAFSLSGFSQNGICGGLFTDSGGVNGNYGENENQTITICPNNPGDFVTVTFIQFDLEPNFDGMYVYDGNSVSSQLIPSGAAPMPPNFPQLGAFWGSNIPGPFAAFNSSGCLTFNFRSDSSVNKTGWIANVTCGPKFGFNLSAFLDNNGDGDQDSGELNFPFGSFNYQKNGGSLNNIISSQSNYYLFENNPANNYNFGFAIDPAFSSYYNVVNPNINNLNVGAVPSLVQVNFPITVTNNLIDLAIANPNESKSIIILAAEEGNSDSITIKTILAITNNSNRRLNPYHIIAEIKIEKNLEVAKMVGKDEIELILTDDIIGRIMVQTSRQSGLSIVYKELMDFEGAEIYFCEERSLIGKTYGESIFAYRDSIVIGLQFTDGVVKINPSMDYELKQGDKIIAISQDDDTLILSNENSNVLNENAIVNENSEKLVAERVLILGWNKRAMIIIRELDNYLGPNSYLKVVSSFDNNKEELLSISESLKNIVLEFDHQDTTDREVIESLDITSYDSLQILCYKEEMDMQEADAQTLITLLHIRRLMEEMGKKPQQQVQKTIPTTDKKA